MIFSQKPKNGEYLRTSGKILAIVLTALKARAKAGVRLAEFDKMTREILKKHEAEPAFLGYKPDGAKKPYGAALCTSVNEVVVHGFPSNYALKDGDVLSLDLGVNYKGFYTDAAETVVIGAPTPDQRLLLETTKGALVRAIEESIPGNYTGDIGWAISDYVKRAGKGRLTVVKDLTGHGIGRSLHEAPLVYNYGSRGEGAILRDRMVLAIEPMVCFGKGDIERRDDDSFALSDKNVSAHFEHTVLVSGNGPVVLTESR